MVANPMTNELIVIKRVAFKRFTQKNLVVLLPDDFSDNMGRLKIILMCDSYIGLDQEYTIDLNKVNDVIIKQAEKKQLEKKAKKSKKIDEDGDEEGQGVKKVVINTNLKPSKMIDTGDEPYTPDDHMVTYNMYTEISRKVLGNQGGNSQITAGATLIASDGDGREEGDSDSSFEFDV